MHQEIKNYGRRAVAIPRKPGLDITLRKAVAAVLATVAVYGGLAMIVYTGYQAVKYVLTVNSVLAEWAVRHGF